MVCRVYVIGAGLGNPQTLTLAARDALAASQLVIGSSRLLEDLSSLYALKGSHQRKLALVSAQAIAQELRDAPEHTASVVMSGDLGFYSGSQPLLGLLGGMDVHTIPGISSLAYLCAKLQMPWHDVRVVSAHGREHDAVGSIQCHHKTFVLLGGADSAADVCARLVARGLADVRVIVGERLSYADERIVRGSAAELAAGSFHKLSVMLAENDHPLRPSAAPHLADDAFVRGKVPMTKEEVRELAICKLRILPASTVWDVGAGTGSVSVEAARAAYAGHVLAVEKNDEALVLLAQNKARFDLSNLTIVAGEAPGALAGLPVPDCVFVGGSSGRLRSIVCAALVANPCVRLCVAAITIETLLAALECIRELGLANVDIAHVSVAKAHEAGPYHLMRAHDPVYLITANP